MFFRTLVALTLCAFVSQAAPPPTKAKGKLVVLLVVDQLAYEHFDRARANFGKDGIERLIKEGALFTDATYGQAATYTGPGHATLATGTYAWRNGIVSNKYFDRTLGKSFTMLADPEHPLLESPADPEDDSSPKNLVGDTLADRLRLASDGRGKAVAIALKDRAAVLLGGRIGSAYWTSETTGKMTTSTWYAKELPGWVAEFNKAHSADAFFGQSWTRSLPEAAYPGKDDEAWEADYKGMGRTFPHKVDGKLDKPGPAFYQAFVATPFALDWEVDFVAAALAAEQLGQRDTTDLLAVSFTPTDYIGHAYGPDSHEALDALVRLDRAVARLLGLLEKQVGKGGFVVALTADHGATPAPEKLAALGIPASRIRKATLKEAVNKAVGERFGTGEWVLALEDPSIWLNDKLAAEKKVDFAQVQQVAQLAALTVPGIAEAYTRAQILEGRMPDSPFALAIQRSFHADHAGDLMLVPAPYSFWGKYGEKNEGSTHGTPYRYDKHVPLVFWGAGVKPQVVRAPVDMSDVAPTIAAILGVEPPASSEGRARLEVLP